MERVLVLLVLLVTGPGFLDVVHSQEDSSENWWRTTPFASLPGMTTQQVLRSILPPDVIPYSPVNSPEDPGQVRNYVSSFKLQSRGMEHLHTYTNLFLRWISPKYLLPPGEFSLYY